jgi:hypothetical protein
VKLILNENPDGIWNGIKSEESEITAGIHNSDLCGVSRFQYMGEEHINLPIAEYAIKTISGLIPIAETIPESAMCALYVHEGRSELMRSYSTTMHCYANKEPHEVIIGKISYGEGSIYVSTFRETEKLPRTLRVKNQLLLNLGTTPKAENLLDGDSLPKQDDADGIPKEAYFLSAKETSEKDFEKILKLCKYRSEEKAGDTPETQFPFKKKSSENGEFLFSRDSTFIFYPVYTPVRRLIANLRQDIPDPLANTYLNMQGNGKAELWVNGEWFGTANKGVRFSEIGLEKGWNYILIRWTPGAMGIPNLKMQWENINGHQEDTFKFHQ